MNSSHSQIDVGLNHHLGFVLTDISADGGELQLQVDHHHLQPDGIVHGGVYTAIVEALGSICGHVWLQGHGGGRVVGVNNSTDFLRPVSTGALTARAAALHRGRRQQLWRVTVSGESGHIVASGQLRLQNLAPEPAAEAVVPRAAE